MNVAISQSPRAKTIGNGCNTARSNSLNTLDFRFHKGALQCFHTCPTRVISCMFYPTALWHVFRRLNLTHNLLQLFHSQEVFVTLEKNSEIQPVKSNSLCPNFAAVQPLLYNGGSLQDILQGGTLNISDKNICSGCFTPFVVVLCLNLDFKSKICHDTRT